MSKYGRSTVANIVRLTELLLLVACFVMPLSAGARAPAVTCSSVFIESLQEYRTSCSNGTYYSTRYHSIFKDWEIRQTFPSGPRKLLPLYRQPRPGARQY